MQRVAKSMEKLAKNLNYLGMLTIFLMMLLMVADITLRFLFNSPILGSQEIVQQMMVVVVFFSFAYTQVKKGHISVDILTMNLPKKVADFFEIISLSFSLVMVAILTYATYVQTLYTFSNGAATSVLYLKHYPFYFIAFLGLLIFNIVLVVNLLESIVRFFAGGVKSNAESC